MSKRKRRIKHRLRSVFSTLRSKFLNHHPDESRLIRCLRRFNGYSSEELEAIALIESLRDKLKGSTETVNVQDFGAGVHDSHSGDDINNGVWVRKNVRDLPVSSKKMGEIMFRLIREFQPRVCLELGTSSGISAAYGIQALKLNGQGKYLTLEGAQEVANVAQKTIEECGYNNFEIIVGKFSDTLEGVLQKNEPVDFAFIDGHHVEEATIEYYQQVLKYVSEKAVIIFDDINWSQGMHNAWNKIIADDNVKASFDLFERGIVILDSSRKDKSAKHYSIKV